MRNITSVSTGEKKKKSTKKYAEMSAHLTNKRALNRVFLGYSFKKKYLKPSEPNLPENVVTSKKMLMQKIFAAS